MPSAEARALTARHRRRVAAVSTLIQRRMRALIRTADTADIDAWWSQAEAQAIELVLRGAGATATLATQYMRRHADAEGVELSPVRAPEPPVNEVATSLLVTGPVAYKEHLTRTGSPEGSLMTMATRLDGSASRLSMAGERQSILSTFENRDQVVGYRRVTSANPCFFCAMLASRGAVYARETATRVTRTQRANRPVGSSYHDHCRCTAELVYQPEEEPPEVSNLSEQWSRVTAGLSGKEAIRAWRRYWTNR